MGNAGGLPGASKPDMNLGLDVQKRRLDRRDAHNVYIYRWTLEPVHGEIFLGRVWETDRLGLGGSCGPGRVGSAGKLDQEGALGPRNTALH